MRDIWLVRHCEPADLDVKRCIGKTYDNDLSFDGQIRASELAVFFSGKDAPNIYCSSLKRSIETAQWISPEYVSMPEFDEVFMGEWDGLSWTQIREKYPDLYEQRGKDISVMPPGSEALDAAVDRFISGINKTKGDSVIVTHRTVIGCFLCRMLDLPYSEMFRYGIYCGDIIRLVEKDGKFYLWPLEDSIEKMYDKHNSPENVRRHCEAVADLSKSIAERLKASGMVISPDLVYLAGLLHDMVKVKGDHARQCAKILRNEGFLSSYIVEKHHESAQILDEAGVLYLADKLMQGDTRVTLEERFGESFKKCKSEEERQRIDDRYKTAAELKRKIESIIGESI